MRRQRKHFYKGFEIRNIQKDAQLKRPAFHIIDGELSVTATTTLRSAHWLIDVWRESPYCACGQPRIPHDHRCKVCVKGKVIHESQLSKQHHRVA